MLTRRKDSYSCSRDDILRYLADKILITYTYCGENLHISNNKINIWTRLLYTYKNRRCDMIVHETAIHQMTVKFKLLKVLLWPSIMIEKTESSLFQVLEINIFTS